jgi:hypothetical protein
MQLSPPPRQHKRSLPTSTPKDPPVSEMHNLDADEEQGSSAVHGESNLVDDDEDSDEPTANFDRAEFEGRYLKRYFFRVPKSTEECAIKFNPLRPTLEKFMNDRFGDFLISPLIGGYGNEHEVNEIAHVYVFLPTRDVAFPAVEEFPSDLRESGLGIVLCRYQTSWLAGPETNP